jgi:hypothetical protein
MNISNTPRQVKKRIMRKLGIKSGRQWRIFRKREGFLTPKQVRRFYSRKKSHE